MQLGMQKSIKRAHGQIVPPVERGDTHENQVEHSGDPANDAHVSLILISYRRGPLRRNETARDDVQREHAENAIGPTAVRAISNEILLAQTRSILLDISTTATVEQVTYGTSNRNVHHGRADIAHESAPLWGTQMSEAYRGQVDDNVPEPFYLQQTWVFPFSYHRPCSKVIIHESCQ